MRSIDICLSRSCFHKMLLAFILFWECSNLSTHKIFLKIFLNIKWNKTGVVHFDQRMGKMHNNCCTYISYLVVQLRQKMMLSKHKNE
jgi:hypothetical protein